MVFLQCCKLGISWIEINLIIIRWTLDTKRVPLEIYQSFILFS